MVIESCFPNQKYMNDSKFERLKTALTATVARTRIPMPPKGKEVGAFWVLKKEQLSMLLDNIDLHQPLDVPDSQPGKAVFMFEAAQRLERRGKTLLICDSMEEKTKRNHAPDEVTIETIESFRQSRQDLTQFKHIMVSATPHKLEAIQDKLKAIPTPIWRIYERDEVPTETVRVVLLGYAKTGKSLLANTIAGEKLFEAGLLKPTTVCQERRASVDNRTFQIMDTPGFSLHNRQNIQTTVEELVSRASSTDAVLLVVKASPMTYEEELLFKHASAIARKPISHKIVLVFTTLDDDITLKGYLKNIPSFLKEFLQFCYNPPVLVNIGTQSKMANDQIHDMLRAIGKIQSTHVQEQQMRRIPHKLTAAIRELEKRYRDNLTRQIQQMQIIL
ncbi:GTPase IMAP family member 4-like [Haliotis rubra]|uniref:GTPase IMAP family member 4-like n=1 Tax=Haliotis rubra TaxID=36100 RepID=UPI001EE53572|nr:GTPase IMAP family member 4-like [Haliotis rubra]